MGSRPIVDIPPTPIKKLRNIGTDIKCIINESADQRNNIKKSINESAIDHIAFPAPFLVVIVILVITITFVFMDILIIVIRLTITIILTIVNNYTIDSQFVIKYKNILNHLRLNSIRKVKNRTYRYSDFSAPRPLAP